MLEFVRLARRLQLLLQNYHSIALLLFNYCILTNVLSYFSLLFLVFTCLSCSSPLLFNRSVFSLCLFRQKLVGPRWSGRCKEYWISWPLQHRHAQTHTNLWDLSSYVHSYACRHARGAVSSGPSLRYYV